MRYFHPTIERHLRKTANRWKNLRFLQHNGTIGTIVCLVLVLLGFGMLRGWLESPYAATGFIVILVLAAGLAWIVLLIVVLSNFREPRAWVAGNLEKAHAPLLDRINTLVFLGEKRRDSGTQSYISRIEKQASAVLSDARPRNPFPVLRPLVHLAVFVAVLVGTIWFYHHYQPWQKMAAAWRERTRTVKAGAAPIPDFKLPDTDASENEKKPWSEVRITDPATDIKATKVDVVPLEIEAASSQALKQVAWALSVDGGRETVRPLDAPAEPHYAVYQPVLSLDELQLSDWDVLSYYAKASTDGGDSSSSELYFIEIRPFREDLLKMPGGENGAPMKMLGEITGLIEQQRLILRQTHRYEQQPDPDAQSRETDRKKLVDAESELNDSVTQYYAELAAKFENTAIGDTLDHLALAGNYMGRATTELQSDFASQAIPLEQGALTELGATRKNFQKFINEHPDAFQDDDPKPVADTGQTEKIAEFRNAEKAAGDFLQKALDKQKEISDKSKNNEPGNYGKLGKEQEDLGKSVSDFESQNPNLFKDLDKQTAAAQQAMKRATTALKTAEARNKLIENTGGIPGASPGGQGSGQGGGQGQSSAAASINAASAKHIDTMQRNAVSSLEELKNAFASANTARQIEHAHELKNLLDHQANDLEHEGADSGKESSGQLQQTAQGAGQAAGQLKDIMDHTGAGKAFGPPVHNALSDAQQAKLSEQLSKAAQAQDAASRKSAAQDAANALRDITQAFNASLPATMRQAQSNNPLSPGGQEALDQAMKEMESLEAAQGGSPMSPESQAKPREDARLALMKSIPEMYGNNDATAALMTDIDKELKANGKPVDAEALKKLTDQIQNFRAEMDDKKTEKPDKEEISHIDPSKLPPEYRERVEHYFQKLSEQ